MTQQIELKDPAPEFALQDTHGQLVRLSDFNGHKNVVLVFNRGFM